MCRLAVTAMFPFRAVKTSTDMKSHDIAVIEMLCDDPDMALDYLCAALGEREEKGGEVALQMALRHVRIHFHDLTHHAS